MSDEELKQAVADLDEQRVRHSVLSWSFFVLTRLREKLDDELSRRNR
jgi:hypothetical protein